MDIKKAVVSSVVLYAIVFVIASGLMLVFPKDSISFRATMPLVVAVLTFVTSKYFYFKDVSLTDPFTDGLALGLLFALVFFTIEVPLMVYGFAAEQGWSYFTQLNLMISYFLLIIVPIIAAYTKKQMK